MNQSSSDDRTRAAIERCRSLIVPRLREAMSATEAGVLATGSQLSQLVTHAVSQADELREVLPLVDSSGRADGIDGAFQGQLHLTEGFVRGILTGLKAQSTMSREAAGMSDAIMKLAASIGEIARSANILTINAKIEATYLGESGRATAVIATEMSEVSRAVARANATIAEAAERLVQLLPAMAQGAERIEGITESFAVDFQAQQEETRRRLDQLRSTVRVALERNEGRSEAVLKLSREALSTLQFQDPMCQDLGEAECAFFDVADEMGTPLDAARPARRLGTELGALDPSAPSAGELQFF